MHAAVVAAAVWLATAPIAAHHSFAGVFDGNSPVIVQGTITRVRWENPHTWIYIHAKDASGATVAWAFEANEPVILSRAGVTADVMKPGLQVTIRGFHARDRSKNMGAVREVIFADGRSIIVGRGGPAWPGDAAAAKR